MRKPDDKVLQINDKVYWTGILDYDIVTFDIVMTTEYGTTYNSYFINSEKKALVETAKAKYWDTYKAKLEQLTDLSEIKYIILDHTEPDHSGSLVHLLKHAPEATVVGSGNAIKYLSDIVGKPFKHLVVKDGDSLDLGDRTLRFISAPNLHWPDSIYTYLEEDKLLFTCDSFGAHYCHEEMFDDKVGDWDDAFKYYFDVILKPYSKFMLKAIEKIRPLEIEGICPGHGPILRSDWKKWVDRSEEYAKAYMELTARNGERRVLITYVSAYGYTKEMATNIAKGLQEVDQVSVSVVDIENISLGDLDEQIVRCDALMVGSPTINQNTLLPVYRMFALINPLRDRGKLATSFGSYGWSGEAPGIIEANLNKLKLKVVQDPLALKFKPDETKEKELVDFGRRFGERLIANQ